MTAWRDKNEFKARMLEWAGKLDVRVRALSRSQPAQPLSSRSAARRFT